MTDYQVTIDDDQRDSEGFGNIWFTYVWKGGNRYRGVLTIQQTMVNYGGTPGVQCLVDFAGGIMPRSNYAPSTSVMVLDTASRKLRLRGSGDRFRLQNSRKNMWDNDRHVTPFQHDEVIMPTLQQLAALITNVPDVVAWDLKNRYNGVKATYDRHLVQYRSAEAAMMRMLDEFAAKGLAAP